ncbi:hypothetical protein A2U01_0067444, partial [Trifolium medium]|nr:hypothetical protein [Trifolium medium]
TLRKEKSRKSNTIEASKFVLPSIALRENGARREHGVRTEQSMRLGALMRPR